MKNHYQHDLYKNDFEFFIDHTDEKAILQEEIKNEITKHKADSLLDIGAGNGMISISLSREVKVYTAVETNPKFIKRLSEAGLEVVEGEFPLVIDESFDMVLSSHSMSYSSEKYKLFLSSAINLLRKNGILLLVTFRGEEDSWTKLLDKLEGHMVDHYAERFDGIITFLEHFGTTTVRKVITHVATDTTDEMIQALSFVYSDGKDEKKQRFLSYKDKLEGILEEEYKQKDTGQYVFPFRHFFIKTIRQ